MCLQVANAAKMNASAVLIYPDRADYNIGPTTQLYGHVSGQLSSFMMEDELHWGDIFLFVMIIFKCIPSTVCIFIDFNDCIEDMKYTRPH